MTALKIVHNSHGSQKKDYVNYSAQVEPKTGVLFTDFISKTIDRKARRMGKSYSRNYFTLIGHIDSFSRLYQANIYTNSVNEAFLDDFISYLEDKNLKLGYIKTLLSLIKSMANKAGTSGYAIDPSYQDVDLKEDYPISVYLSMNEITRIYYFRGLTKKQERIRDLFVVGCLTGLRYSDYSSLTRSDFREDYIVKTTKKTRKKVIIPIHDYVKEIYQKYDGEVSPGLSIQHFNRYLKKICKEIGFNDIITYTYTRGGKLVTETKEKWEKITTHTARRSAATNMYITGRMKTYEIMALTGHTTEKSFFRYIRISDEDKAKKIAGDNFFRK